MGKVKESLIAKELVNDTYNLGVNHCISLIEILDKHDKLNKEEAIKSFKELIK